MAYSGVNLFHQDMYALDLLSWILGEGQSSRLYQKIYKDEGLVYSIDSSNFTPIDRGVFEVEAVLDYKNLESTIDTIKLEIEDIKKKGVKSDELKKVKRKILSFHLHRIQTASQMAWSQAVDEAFAGDYQFTQKYVEAIKSIANKDIMRVARKYLNDRSLSITVLKPENERTIEQSQKQEIKRGEIEKHTLENGMTVLIREDHSFPLISVKMLLNGGVRTETADNNGLNTLLAGAWTKGTKSMSSKQIAVKTDSLGISLGGSSGNNSIFINLNCLSEDFEEALDMLEDIIKNPTFPQHEIDKIKENMRTSLRQREDTIFRYTALNLSYPNP